LNEKLEKLKIGKVVGKLESISKNLGKFPSPKSNENYEQFKSSSLTEK